jgi:hypothetical protein
MYRDLYYGAPPTWAHSSRPADLSRKLRTLDADFQES